MFKKWQGIGFHTELSESLCNASEEYCNNSQQPTAGDTRLLGSPDRWTFIIFMYVSVLSVHRNVHVYVGAYVF